jgi:hypothetical protein
VLNDNVLGLKENVSKIIFILMTRKADDEKTDTTRSIIICNLQELLQR